MTELFEPNLEEIELDELLEKQKELLEKQEK